MAEAKTNPSQKDVQELVRHIQSFPKFFHEYKGWSVMGVLAGVKVSSGVAACAEKCGLYVLSPSGKTMKVLNKKVLNQRCGGNGWINCNPSMIEKQQA